VREDRQPRAHLRLGQRHEHLLLIVGQHAALLPDLSEGAEPLCLRVACQVLCNLIGGLRRDVRRIVSIDDSSVYPDDTAGSAKGNPSFRSFRASNSMVLKNGETGQFTSATDKVTGETVRVDVTLTVVK
jgi:hypothetical protein